jgi:hypothetical protein
MPYERIHADAGIEAQLGLLTSMRAGAQWNASRVLQADLAQVMPPQMGASVDGAVSRRVTERHTLEILATGAWSETDMDAGRTSSASATAEAAWRTALGPLSQGWVRAGAGAAYTDDHAGPARRDVFPTFGAGLANLAIAEQVTGDLSARVTTYVDRFTGAAGPLLDGSALLRANVARDVSLVAQTSGGRSLDGATTFGTAEARMTWTVRPQVALEGGALWHLQRERNPQLPSFSEVGFFAGVRTSTARR